MECGGFRLKRPGDESVDRAVLKSECVIPFYGEMEMLDKVQIALGKFRCLM
jgi:hypothetical protein